MSYHNTLRWGPWILRLLHNTKPVFMNADSNRESEVMPFTYKRTNHLVMSVISCNTVTLQLTFPLTYWYFAYCYDKPQSTHIPVPAMETSTGQSLNAGNQFSEYLPNPKALCAGCFQLSSCPGFCLRHGCVWEPGERGRSVWGSGWHGAIQTLSKNNTEHET